MTVRDGRCLYVNRFAGWYYSLAITGTTIGCVSASLSNVEAAEPLPASSGTAAPAAPAPVVVKSANVGPDAPAAAAVRSIVTAVLAVVSTPAWFQTSNWIVSAPPLAPAV